MEQSLVSAKEDAIILGNPALASDYELPEEKGKEPKEDTPDGYTEPLFDGEPEEKSDSDDYSVARNDTIVDQLYTNSGSHCKRSQSFVQPPACLISLLAQIKETTVLEISSESIWYVYI